MKHTTSAPLAVSLTTAALKAADDYQLGADSQTTPVRGARSANAPQKPAPPQL